MFEDQFQLKCYDPGCKSMACSCNNDTQFALCSSCKRDFEIVSSVTGNDEYDIANYDMFLGIYGDKGQRQNDLLDGTSKLYTGKGKLKLPSTRECEACGIVFEFKQNGDNCLCDDCLKELEANNARELAKAVSNDGRSRISAKLELIRLGIPGYLAEVLV